MTSTHSTPPRWQHILALATVYLGWGSVYLAIAFAIESLPPFIMMGARFLFAGAVLHAWVRLRGEAAPSRRQWGAAALVGALLLAGGVGLAAWAQLQIPSWLSAVLVSTVPLWMVVLDWLAFGGSRPALLTALGLALGLLGIMLLVEQGGQPTGEFGGSLTGIIFTLVGSISWAVASLLSRRLDLPESAFMTTSMQMLGGGLLLVIVGVLVGEPAQLNLAGVALKSWLALGYLVVVSGIAAFTAYTWLLRWTTPAIATTYAYVNPVTAMLLGLLLGGESISRRGLLAAVVLLAGVTLISLEPVLARRKLARTLL